jgi:GT2 family glycosyltransferase
MIHLKAGSFRPAKMLVFELSTGEVSDLPTGRFPLDPKLRYEVAHVLVRLHEAPIGFFRLDLGKDLKGRIREEAWLKFPEIIAGHMEADGLPVPKSAKDLKKLVGATCKRSLPDGSGAGQPLVTVVIPTLKNLRRLIPCVDGVLNSTYKNIDVLVVNNDPEAGAVEEKIAEEFNADGRVRYIHEPRIGVSNARNAAIEHARGDIVVFADDDVVVDRNWIGAIVDVFVTRPETACVTGPIFAAEMETRAQHLLEQYGGFDKGFEQQIFDMGENRRDEPMYPFDAGRFGSGANMAFRLDVFKKLGGFSTNLGPGTPTWGGEDIDLARRLVWSGHQLVYEPMAAVWHFHRRRWDDLTRTLYRYGVGLGAMLTNGFTESPRSAGFMLKALPAGVAHVFSPDSRKNQKKTEAYPKQLNLLELSGLLMGPLAYLRSRLAKTVRR